MVSGNPMSVAAVVNTTFVASGLRLPRPESRFGPAVPAPLTLTSSDCQPSVGGGSHPVANAPAHTDAASATRPIIP